MKWLIASDLHGDAHGASLLVEAFLREGASRIILLGDILYHGPRNGLPECYDPKKVAALLNAHKRRIVSVRGNCDSEVDQMMLEFPILADYMLIPLGSRTVFATHGHVFNTDNMPPVSRGDILLSGHTHVPVCETLEDGSYRINPGAVSFPKNGSPRSYMVLEDGVFRWKTLEGEEYRTFEPKEDVL
jgi:hypothetical protein